LKKKGNEDRGKYERGFSSVKQGQALERKPEEKEDKMEFVVIALRKLSSSLSKQKNGSATLTEKPRNHIMIIVLTISFFLIK